jgi:hypothetical protein
MKIMKQRRPPRGQRYLPITVETIRSARSKQQVSGVMMYIPEGYNLPPALARHRLVCWLSDDILLVEGADKNGTTDSVVGQIGDFVDKLRTLNGGVDEILDDLSGQLANERVALDRRHRQATSSLDSKYKALLKGRLKDLAEKLDVPMSSLDIEKLESALPGAEDDRE